jgi:serine/threonine-protein kinase
VVLLGAGGIVAWRALTPRVAGPGLAAGSGGPGAGRPEVPAGFVECGDALCPETPMCWRGLVQVGDEGRPPGRSECGEPHYWETFAAGRLPADAVSDYDLAHLMERPDIAALCSETAMQGRSRDAAQTRGWRREAWPIPADAFTVLVHCLGGSPEGETPGAVFRAG